jgi:hypothetical protein
MQKETDFVIERKEEEGKRIMNDPPLCILETTYS